MTVGAVPLVCVHLDSACIGNRGEEISFSWPIFFTLRDTVKIPVTTIKAYVPFATDNATFKIHPSEPHFGLGWILTIIVQFSQAQGLVYVHDCHCYSE